MLQASEGDSLLLHYGVASKPSHVVIDSGRKATWKALQPRLEAACSRGETLELLVITHIDRDHIEGVLELMQADSIAKSFRDIWFNGFHHLVDQRVEPMGVVQGEALTDALLTLGLPWNSHKRWHGGPVALAQPDEPVRVSLDGGLQITLLSPWVGQLKSLRKEWEEVCLEAGLVPGLGTSQRREHPALERYGIVDVEKLAAAEFTEDSAKPNGSSIAFIAEYDGHRVLLGADAHPSQLLCALGALGGRQKLSAFKLPHHGSKANLSTALLQAVACSRYVVSTNGTYFQHPDRETIARIIKCGGADPALIFNYESRQSRIWRDAGLRERYRYRTQYPAPGADCLTLDLADGAS